MKITKYIYKNFIQYKTEYNQLHRLKGPAVELINGFMAYYVNGKQHRLNGSSREYVTGTKIYRINGILLTTCQKQKIILLNELLT